MGSTGLLQDPQRGQVGVLSTRPGTCDELATLSYHQIFVTF